MIRVNNGKEDKTFPSRVETQVVSSRPTSTTEVMTFLEDDPKWTLEEIVLPKEIRETIEEVILFCQKRDILVNQWNLNQFLKAGQSVGVNLYGEPGTGKSITADAIAKALGKKILRMDYSEIQDSKWGGTEKKLSALFKQAEDNDSVIFIDEADGLLGKRTSSGANSEVYNEMKSHLLTLIDKSNAVIIYATNIFKNYDRAFFRRILYHVHIPLPNTEQRIALWKFHLNESIPRAAAFSFERAAELSEGLSGGDIKNITLKLCIKLASEHISEITIDALTKEIEKYKTSLKDIGSITGDIVAEEIKESELPKNVKEEFLK